MDFVSGVVEGFYGTPWRVSERKELFERLKSLDLNTYMYAPKDDAKHRKLWREKYTLSEKGVLKTLIEGAHAQSIEFVYAISPGLDIVFSSPADITSLKEKLEQVYGLGCKSFALLFDDIDPELCLADKSDFSSFGAAQVFVCNKVFEWFEELKLVLFCPTEYCCTRAKPDVKNSEYLQCLGNDLNNKVHIMWTGPKVVPQTIDAASINALSKVLKRKPLLWDNIHANDYDQRRIFLGPFKGLQLEMFEYTSGILKNPNCEFECNFIAIHSMATWLRLARAFSENNKPGDKSTNGESSSGSSNNNNDDNSLYDSKLALCEAVDCWMELILLSRDTLEFSKFHAKKITQGTHLNSLLSDEIVDVVTDDKSETTCEDNATDGKKEGSKEDSPNEVSPEKKARQTIITTDDVLLLCELFYLPYEHGERGLHLIQEFKWLKENAIDYQQQSFSKEMVEKWVDHAREFNITCQQVQDMYERFLEISNKRLLEQLFPYIYDVKEAVFHLSKYVKWLGSVERQNGSSFLPKDPEAWFYRGGIAEEMERLLPTPGTGISQNNSAAEEKQIIYIIRPYLKEDKKVLFQICRDLSASPTTYMNFPDLAGDSLIEAYLEYSPRNVFVIEVDGGVCGYVAAHCNGKEFFEKVKKKWLPSICKLYKKPGGDPDTWTPEQHMINRLHYPQFFTPDDLFNQYEAVLSMRLLPNVQNDGVCHQALKCVKAAIKSNLSIQLKASLSSTYEKLLNNSGFSKISSLKDIPPGDVILYGLKMK